MIDLGCACGTVWAQAGRTVVSPDRRTRVTVGVEGELHWSVMRGGRPVLLDSPLGLELKGAPPLGGSLVMRDEKRRKIDTTWRPVYGKRSVVRDRANEMTLGLEERVAPWRHFDLIVRAADDGVAFRYYLPRQPGLGALVVTREATQFRFPGDPVVWAAEYGGFSSSQEGAFQRQRMTSIAPEATAATPMLIRVNASCYAAITEAELKDWGGMYLGGTAAIRGEKLIETPVLRGGDEPRAIHVPLAGKRTLLLVVGDGGDNYAFDHADWADARLVRRDGTSIALSTLNPVSARQGWGQLQLNRSVDGRPLRLGKKSYGTGLGTHSMGEIVYNLPGEIASLEAEVGIDAETEGRGSATFSVWTAGAAKVDSTTLVARLSPRRNDPDQALVRTQTPHYSPWRVLMLGERPGDLVESDLIANLSEPCAIRDTRWIKPGKCAWDHWWSGDVQMDTPTMKEYVQFAADMGFPYQLVDWQWYGSFGRPNSDITHVNPNLDMEELRRFARARHVRLIVWLHSADVDRKLRAGQLDDVFALYERWGLAGVKIDFMDRDDQEMVNWYQTIIRKAAAHHLLVDFHGAYKPTGTQRTWPNQITREGVMGEEYDKFSDGVTPEHDCTLPFTRMLAGPMDYTPGGFLNWSKARWRRTTPTEVQGTRCHELAKFVIFDSPLTVLCDHPRNYRGQVGLEFLKRVPTTWSDTWVPEASVGEYVVEARRFGRDWFLGAMTNWDPRPLSIPLKFLGSGRWTARIWRDAPDAGEEAMHAIEEVRTVESTQTLSVPLASGGGAAVLFTPAH